jgi:hypothetical protein
MTEDEGNMPEYQLKSDVMKFCAGIQYDRTSAELDL